MSEWLVGQWIVGVMNFQKMYGLYGLKNQLVEINRDATEKGRTDVRTTKEDRATQLLV